MVQRISAIIKKQSKKPATFRMNETLFLLQELMAFPSRKIDLKSSFQMPEKQKGIQNFCIHEKISERQQDIKVRKEVI